MLVRVKLQSSKDLLDRISTLLSKKAIPTEAGDEDHTVIYITGGVEEDLRTLTKAGMPAEKWKKYPRRNSKKA